MDTVQKFPKHTMVTVLETAPFHGGKTGYVEFYGKGSSKGVVVLRTFDSTPKRATLFAVKDTDIELG